MTGPALLLTVLGLIAAGLLLRPLRRALLGGRSPRARAAADAGGLVLIGVLLFALRLAPLGLIAFVLAGGRLTQGMTGDRAPPGLGDDQAPPPRRADGMDRSEALSVLGLDEGADDDAIDAAHRKMIVRAHPDQGGSAYLAAKVNEAREVLRRNP